MRILRFKNVNELAARLEQDLRERVKRKKGSIRVFLPTGKSPEALYERLREEAGFWQKKIAAIQIDEFIQPGRLFLKKLEREILKPLSLECKCWDPDWSEDQIQNHIADVLSAPIDVALLGLGPNGHVGFHEPGQRADFVGGKVTISNQTKERVLDAETHDALTFGVGAFMKAEEICLIVSGSGKTDAFQKFQKGLPTPELPVSLLKPHPNLFVYTTLT